MVLGLEESILGNHSGHFDTEACILERPSLLDHFGAKAPSLLDHLDVRSPTFDWTLEIGSSDAKALDIRSSTFGAKARTLEVQV